MGDQVTTEQSVSKRRMVKATILCWFNNLGRRLAGRPTVSRDNWLQ